MTIGTSIKITAVMDSTPTTAKISIYDPNGVLKATLQTMTLLSGYTYYYIYQSATTDTAGTYTALVQAVSGAYTSYAKVNFKLNEVL